MPTNTWHIRFDFSENSNLSYLNISKNDGISKVTKIVNDIKSDYLTLIIDELNFEEVEKIIQNDSNKNLFIKETEIKLNDDK